MEGKEGGGNWGTDLISTVTFLLSRGRIMVELIAILSIPAYKVVIISVNLVRICITIFISFMLLVIPDCQQ